MLPLMTPVAYAGRTYLVTGRTLEPEPLYDISDFDHRTGHRYLRGADLKVLGEPQDAALIRIPWDPEREAVEMLQSKRLGLARQVA